MRFEDEFKWLCFAQFSREHGQPRGRAGASGAGDGSWRRAPPPCDNGARLLAFTRRALAERHCFFFFGEPQRDTRSERGCHASPCATRIVRQWWMKAPSLPHSNKPREKLRRSDDPDRLTCHIWQPIDPPILSPIDLSIRGTIGPSDTTTRRTERSRFIKPPAYRRTLHNHTDRRNTSGRGPI